MSSRTYPMYRLGNPQLRIFLPNLWMKLLKPRDEKRPPNSVVFSVSPEMTRLDVKNYLEKIYNVPVMNVHTFNGVGKTHMHPLKFIYQEPNFKLAFVTLAKDVKFEFPDVVKKDVQEDKADRSKRDVADAEKSFNTAVGSNTGRRRGVPSFFGL